MKSYVSRVLLQVFAVVYLVFYSAELMQVTNLFSNDFHFEVSPQFQDNLLNTFSEGNKTTDWRKKFLICVIDENINL